MKTFSNIAVAGTGYVGLTQSVGLAELGWDVIGYDIDEAKIAALRAGRPHFYEPKLEEMLRRNLETGRLQFTSDPALAFANADVAFVCVGTPPMATGDADVSQVIGVARTIATSARCDVAVVLKSTTPPGTTFEAVASALRDGLAPGLRGAVVVNPEFLREGSAIDDFFKPDRIVLGAEDGDACERVAALYNGLKAPVLMTDPATAKLVKYAANAFLATKISFINEVARIARRVGADATTVARGIGLDSRIGDTFLDPGLGYGGSCFPKDVLALYALAERHGHRSSLLSAVMRINEDRRDLAVETLDARLGGLAGKHICVLGLAFKPETDDVREAPALKIIASLNERDARVRAYDPAALDTAMNVLPERTSIRYFENAYAAASDSDAILIATDWDEFRTLNWSRMALVMSGRTLVDGRNLLHPDEMIGLGFDYVSLS